MKHLIFVKYSTLLFLLALAPLSWGEDVWYCEEEHVVELGPADSGDAYELIRYKTGRFTLKYEAGEDRLAIKGKPWGGDLHYMECEPCYPDGFFNAKDSASRFTMKEDGRFFYVISNYREADMKTGTCTKF